MTRVLTQGDDAFVIDTSSGETMRIHRDVLADALSSGTFLPASKKEVDKLQTKEKYSGTGGEIAAGAAGAARALTFGLSDPIIKATGLASAEELRLLKELNPTASGAGELVGTAASILIPGGPLGAVGKGAAKLGTRAAGTVARATGRAAESFVPALAGNIAREAAIGAVIGVGGGVSELALSPREMTTSEQALALLGHAGKGAALGVAFGGVATGLGAGVRYARKTLFDVKGIEKLRGQKTQLTSELESLRSSRASSTKIAATEEKLTKIATQLGQKQSRDIKSIATNAIAYGIGHAISGGTGGLLGVIVAPRAFKILSKALTPISGNLNATWKNLRSKITSGAETAGKTGIKTAARGKRFMTSRDMEARVAATAETESVEVTGGALISSYLEKKFLHHLTNVLTNKITPIGRAVISRGLLDDNLLAMVNGIKSEDAQELETSLRMSMPGNAPQAVTEPAVQQTMRALTYMIEQVGVDGSDGKIPYAKKVTKKIADKNKIERNIKAVVEPETVLQSFSEQKLTAGQVQAWERVYPGALNELRTIVQAEIDRVNESGQRFSRKQAEQIALLLGDRALAPRMYDPNVLRRMQISHKNNRDIKKAPQLFRGRKIHLSQLHRTTMQRIGER